MRVVAGQSREWLAAERWPFIVGLSRTLRRASTLEVSVEAPILPESFHQNPIAAILSLWLRLPSRAFRLKAL